MLPFGVSKGVREMIFDEQTIKKAEELYKITPDMSVEAIKETVAQIIQFITLQVSYPQAVVRNTLRLTADETKVVAIEFGVRISKKSGLPDLKRKRFNVLVTDCTTSTIVRDFIAWYEDVCRYADMSVKVQALNDLMTEIEVGADIDFSLRFAYADQKIVDVSDDSIVIGLSAQAIDRITEVACATDGNARTENYLNMVIDTLKACNRPMDILGVNTVFTKHLELKTRVQVCNLLKKTCSKQAKNIRDGVGYIDVDGIFAIVTRYFVSEAEGAELINKLGEPAHVEMKKSTSKKLADKVKVLTYYKLSPIDKTTLEPEELVLDFGA